MSALELTPDELVAALGDAELEVVARMRYSSNATFLAEARVDGAEITAIYKPRRGERPLWDFPEGSLCDREVAAYEVSRALGWDIVPVTILRDGPYGEGAVQRFVDHDPAEHYFTLFDDHVDRFREFAAYDVLVNNTDRKGGHCLHDLANDVVVGIDHGLTFHAAWKLRTVIWEFAGEPLTPSAATTCAGWSETSKVVHSARASRRCSRPSRSMRSSSGPTTCSRSASPNPTAGTTARRGRCSS